MGKGVTQGHRTSRRTAADDVPDGDAPSPPTITPRQQQAVWINPPEDKTKSEIKLH
jgi:hypothetical protein